MITAITFQFGYNKSYKNKELMTAHVFGERSTVDLQNAINEDVSFLKAVHSLVSELNKELNNANVVELVKRHLKGHEPSVRNITKSKRTYSIAGLTIHEEDK